MSTSSGKAGACRACGHINNKHSYHKCTVCNKREAWKTCQATGAHPNAKRTSTYGKYKVCCSGVGPFPSFINNIITCCKSKATLLFATTRFLTRCSRKFHASICQTSPISPYYSSHQTQFPRLLNICGRRGVRSTGIAGTSIGLSLLF